jgi:hypothetical protein
MKIISLRRPATPGKVGLVRAAGNETLGTFKNNHL